MKEFFKMLGASILGCILVFFAGGIVVMGFITALVSMSISEVGTVPNKAILQITFEKPILEQALSNPLSRFILYYRSGFHEHFRSWNGTQQSYPSDHF